MTTLSMIFSGLAIALTVHTVIFSSSATWYSKTAAYWSTSPNVAQQRKAAPPWYVRYADWVDRKVSRHERP